MRHRRSHSIPSLALLALLSGALHLAAGASEDPGYPCWRGFDGSGAARPSGRTVLADPTQAKLIWTSETLPGAYGAPIQSGQAGPVVADERVFLYYYDPVGPTLDESQLKPFLEELAAGTKTLKKPWTKEILTKKCSIETDDVVIALDAGTGKTLWTYRGKGRGLNFAPYGRSITNGAKAGPHAIPVVMGGRVYAMGSAGAIYCLDAATGKLAWELDGPAWAVNLRRRRVEEKSFVGSREFDIRSAFCSPPTVAGGVYVCNRGGLCGYDGATGKQLWGPIAKSCSSITGPVRWLHGGQEYIVCDGAGYDPRTGKQLWTVATPLIGSISSSVDHDHMVMAGDSKTVGMQGYRITPSSVTKIWEAPPALAATGYGVPLIMDGRVYAKINTNPGMAWTCLDVETGKHLGISEKIHADQRPSMIGADGLVFYGNAGDGQKEGIMIFRGGAEGINYLGLIACNWAQTVTPAICGGRLYVRLQTGIACYDYCR